MATNLYQESLKSFQPRSELDTSRKGLSLQKLWGGTSPTLPFSQKDTMEPGQATGGVAGWSSWPSTWSITVGQEASWWETLGLSRTQRYTAFALCLAAGALFFLLAMLQMPLMPIRPAKFVVPFVFGTIFVLLSFPFVHGFVSYGRHLFSPERLPYTITLAAMTAATLFSALSLRSYVLTMISAVIQIITLAAYLVSYVPGGSSGIRMMGGMIGSRMTTLLSVV